MYYFQNMDALGQKPKRVVDQFGGFIFGDFDDATLATYNIFPYQVATYDAATEKLGDIQVVNGVASEAVIPLTQAEIDAQTLASKQRQFKQAFALLARISVSVFEKLKADGVISATDFPADIRQDYQDFKTLMNELYPQ